MKVIDRGRNNNATIFLITVLSILKALIDNNRVVTQSNNTNNQKSV